MLLAQAINWINWDTFCEKITENFFSFSTINFYLTLPNLVRKIIRAPKSLLLKNQQNLKKSFDLFRRIIAKEN